MAKRARVQTETLSRRALNRALLARQMLLERSGMPVGDVIGFLGGLQAQVPSDPYTALWSRLVDFDPTVLSELISTRKAVRLATLRGTLHLHMAADAVPFRALVQPVLTRMLAGTPFGKATKGVEVDALVAAGRAAVEKTPLTLAALRPILAEVFPDHDATALSYVVHYMTPLIQVPPRGLWGKGGAPKVTTAKAWLGKEGKAIATEKAVVRYLAAFGPASVLDMQAWSGLTKLGPTFEALRPKLVTFTDPSGRELFDLPDAPRPDESTPAPPRFLPVYENAILGFAERERILAGVPPRAVPQSVNVRSFLIDGFVAGFWKMETAKATAKVGATLTLEPFAKLAKKDERALAAEGERMLAFAAPEAKGAVRFGKVY